MRERKTRIERRWAPDRERAEGDDDFVCGLLYYELHCARRVGVERRVRTLGDEQPQCDGPWNFWGV